MSLLELKSKTGRKKRKRVGRGNGSGHGTFSCKGMKGQTSRSGGRRRPGFEGGQTPLIRKMPKLKGFKQPNKVEFLVINLGDLNAFNDGETVNRESLLAKKIISNKVKPIKLLAGKGELTKSLTVAVDKASKEALNKVEAQKGTVTLTSK